MGAMSESNQTKSSLGLRIAVDLVLCAGFFTILFLINRSHVPSLDPFMINFWSAAATACMTVVFWLALQMFRVVLKAYRESKR